MDVKVGAVQFFGALESRERLLVSAGFEIHQTQPVLNLCVLRPARRGRGSDPFRFPQSSCFQVGEQQAPVGLEILRGALAGLLKVGGGTRQIARVERRLAASDQSLDLRSCFLRPIKSASRYQEKTCENQEEKPHRIAHSHRSVLAKRTQIDGAGPGAPLRCAASRF